MHIWFYRYAHPITKRLKGKNLSTKDLATASELEKFGDDFAEEFSDCLKHLFPQRMKSLCLLYEKERSLGRMGSTSFSGLGISKDYSSFPHFDRDDYGYSFIAWYLDRTQYISKGLSAGGEFLLPEYGIFLQPRHGTMFVLDTKRVCHCTRRNIGHTQVGSVAYTKMKVIKCGEKRSAAIGLG